MEKSFTKRLQELAGITDESKMKSRIDQALEKAKKNGTIYSDDDGDNFETGTEEYLEFIGEIYQVPFEYDDEELEEEENYPHSKFFKLIDKKAEEINFSWGDIEDYLETKGIEFV